MNRIFLLVLLLIIFGNSVSAQYQPPYTLNENKVWAISDHSGLDFNSGAPVLINTSLYSAEGSASVCDGTGDLLFYCNSDTVWNRNHQAMSNGFDMCPTGGLSTTQAATIVQTPGNANRYYVFTLSHIADTLLKPAKLYYSIVDMSLNGTLGDVLPQSKSILLDSLLSEKLLVLPGANCDYWLLTHTRVGTIFKAYHIDGSGLSLSPVLSNVGGLDGSYPFDFGVMKASQDGHTIAMCNYNSKDVSGNWGHDGSGLELFDFDAVTGSVSNSRVIDSTRWFYGACFSPLGTKLYAFAAVGMGIPAMIVQYDLTNSDPVAIRNSETVIKNYPNYSATTDLKLATDSSIYFIGQGSVIDRITYPELPGVACGHVNAVLVTNDADLGLPADFILSPCETSVRRTAKTDQVLSIFPNPTSNNISITTGTPGTASLLIYDFAGRLLIKRDIVLKDTATSVDLNLQSGIYLLEMTDSSGKKYVQKLVIQ